MAWTCVKCACEMQEVDDIEITYGDMALPEAAGLRCPQCEKEYLLADFVIDELNPSEQMLEGK